MSGGVGPYPLVQGRRNSLTRKDISLPKRRVGADSRCQSSGVTKVSGGDMNEELRTGASLLAVELREGGFMGDTGG